MGCAESVPLVYDSNYRVETDPTTTLQFFSSPDMLKEMIENETNEKF